MPVYISNKAGIVDGVECNVNLLFKVVGVGEGDKVVRVSNEGRGSMLRFAKRCPTWTRIVWMQPLMT
jgi:hypothetical protein